MKIVRLSLFFSIYLIFIYLTIKEVLIIIVVYYSFLSYHIYTMVLLDQISNAQDKSSLRTALQSSMEASRSDLDAIKTELEGKVWTTKDQLANFMNEIYDKLYDRTDNGDIAKTAQDLDALKTLAKIQVYWNKELWTHADQDPDLVRWKRTTATLRKVFKNKNWVDQQQDTDKESATVPSDTDVYGYIYENNQTKIKVNDEVIDIIDQNGLSPDSITIGSINYKNYYTIDQAEQFSWLGYKMVTDGVYFGDFKDNMMDGKWTKVWTDGSSYNWEWKGDKMDWLWIYTNKYGIKFDWNRSDNLYQEDNQSLDVTTLNQDARSIETRKAGEAIKKFNQVALDAINSSIKQLEKEKKEMINIWWRDYKIEDGHIDVDGTIYKDCTNPTWDAKFSGKWFIRNINGDDILYVGDIVDNKAQGIWKLCYSNWDVYEWFLQNWQSNGRWKMVWKDGSKYDWDWKDGKMDWEWSYINPHKIAIEWFFENDQYIWTWSWLMGLFGWWKEIKRDKKYMNSIKDQASVDNPWWFR